MNLFVRSSGFLSSVQDIGRLKHRRAGVSTGGALDRHAMRVANALVGNEETAAGLEVTLGNVRLGFEDTRVVAWCGGAFNVKLSSDDLPAGHSAIVKNDEELVMTAPHTGARAWLAISGGIAVPPVLGSRSTDLRGNFGGHDGRVLRDGDRLPLGKTALSFARLDQIFGNRRIGGWSAPAPWITSRAGTRFLRITRGSDWSRFSDEAHTLFVSSPYEVSLDSDRMAARLEGPELSRNDSSELLSEAVVPGTIQVPANGKPIVLLGDCQTIGGYPKIAHVIAVDSSIAAQLWPGDVVRFHQISLAEAQTLLWEREHDFARFRVGINLRLG